MHIAITFSVSSSFVSSSLSLNILTVQLRKEGSVPLFLCTPINAANTFEALSALFPS